MSLTIGPTTGPISRPWKRKRYRNIREYAVELILRVDRIEILPDGRERLVGFDYERIRQFVLKKFPTVTYSGPHKGEPTKMTYKELHEIACVLNREHVRLPVRPRRRVRR